MSATRPATVEQVYFPQCEVVGDVGPSLELLADRIETKLPNAGALLPLREGILMRIADRSTEARFPPTPQRIVHDVRQVIPEDGIIALDNGMYKIWFARNYRTYVANTVLLDNALATMGAGLPSAMMASMLYPQRRVMAVCGDGGFMMNSQEMETAVRLKLNLVVLILEDFRLWHDPLEAGGGRIPRLRAYLRQSGFRQVRRELRRQRLPRHLGRWPDPDPGGRLHGRRRASGRRAHRLFREQAGAGRRTACEGEAGDSDVRRDVPFSELLINCAGALRTAS